MKVLITILLLAGALYMFKQLLHEFQDAKRAETGTQQTTAKPKPNPSASLPGMPPGLEPGLEAAHREGADGLGRFLDRYYYSIKDPRLAAIELDFALLLSLKKPEEARRVFKSVQDRILPSSPVYERVKGLEKTFQ